MVVVTPSYLPFSETITFRFDSLHGIDTVSAKTSITRRTSSTGRETIGLSKAQGVVVLLNQQQKEVRVPKGTILKTGNGVSFETLKDVVVPAVSTQYFMDVPTGLQAGKAEVAVRALESGASGNVAAGRISLVEGFNLDVRNPEPTNGGEDLVKMFVTETDLARAKELVLKDARQLALETLYQTIKNGLVLDDTLLVNIEWKEGSTAGEEGPEAYVSAIAHGQISRADTERLSAQIIDVLNEIISPGFEVVPATIKVIETTVTNDNGEYNLKVKVEGYCQGLVEEVLLKDLLLGREVEEVANVCASLPHIAEIAVVEAKRDRLPRWSNWVRLEIQQPY